MRRTKIDYSFSQTPRTYRGYFPKATPSLVIHCLYWDVNLDFLDYEVVCNYKVVCNYELVCNLNILTTQ